MLNNLVAFDFETTSVDPETCEILEFGWLLWDFKRDQILRLANYLTPFRGEVTPQIQSALRVNKIDIEDTKKHGIPLPTQVFHFAEMLADNRDSIAGLVAHNGLTFDHIILSRIFNQALGEKGVELLDSLLKLDTILHVTPEKRGKSLEVLAARMTWPLANPFPHRAITDCMTLTRVAKDEGVEKILGYAREPIFIYVPAPGTEVKPWKDGGAYNAKLKQLGLRWNGTHWHVQCFESEREAMLAKATELEVKLALF